MASSERAPTKVIIVGCGVAGPVLACFLKFKGYTPVVYERIVRDSEGGLSLMLQANGLRVLALIPGLLDQLPGVVEDHMEFCSTVPGHEDQLGVYTYKTSSDTARINMEDLINIPGIGIRRHDFLHLLSETALQAGVEIHYERKVVDVHQHADSVEVKFEDGTTDTASFVIGCDGIHSNTRVSLFGKEEASYTGLTQLGGFSPAPKSWKHKNTMINFFGEESHMISYQVGPNLNSWAITRREAEHKETWRAVDDSMLQELRKRDPVSEWGFGAGELLQTAHKMIKYGLYDRPELKTWYKGRVVLLGDAAHPTSPHLGQGANQALEDIYHLVRVLMKYNPSAGDPSTEVLKNAFEEYEDIRLPRTSALVKQAHEVGDKMRVISGVDACLARNESVRATWANPEIGLRNLARARSGPFEGKSEI